MSSSNTAPKAANTAPTAANTAPTAQKTKATNEETKDKTKADSDPKKSIADLEASLNKAQTTLKEREDALDKLKTILDDTYKLKNAANNKSKDPKTPLNIQNQQKALVNEYEELIKQYKQDRFALINEDIPAAKDQVQILKNALDAAKNAMKDKPKPQNPSTPEEIETRREMITRYAVGAVVAAAHVAGGVVAYTTTHM